MILIKDAMVLIHLAKLSLLEKSCNYFKKVIIPELIYQEILKGEKKGFPDVQIIVELIKNKKIIVKKVKDHNLIKKVNQFNIQRGEAEVVALYWQESQKSKISGNLEISKKFQSKADVIATDDDNIRKKKILLNIEVIGTPAIILKLYKEKIINKYKIEQCISGLRKIGWFSNIVLDKILMEVKK